ncbi:circularly permuted type 2 ATP-grasp protein [Gemmata sp. G18]|uniref:Circularly permuted type 2 ATP-grasp protein n=1 Tax=Gemmata palustris TaxID=2822762 RepID=A0ABS5BJR5_9BACT|nr:circularly permuted type 2 ATP-grasp protein [Gemmata palustris]MBP3953944.1 circularly permuted type 2 ATP-grasp protein [Gemmata palustris]
MPDTRSHAPIDPHVPPGADPRAGYESAPGFDESTDRNGTCRPHWIKFFDSLHELGPTEMARRWREAKDLIRENGVTYNVYGDPDGIARPWQLDPIPLLIPHAEAAALERGLVQRARLLELVLADLYGPQWLLKDGILPPELIVPNPGFLRPVHGIRVPGGRYLHLYAANLGRGFDGRWRVIGDRTQAPSGAGYALENRIVMTRTLPEAFQDCRVNRLALFFQTVRDTLRALAPRNKDNPRVVLLTPGPYNETYFEHAYLARYLGYTLCEGGDLTVRDNRVFLKVLGGLQPVEVIFRRLDDDFCDPLELRPDSFLGVPGLVHAVRSGNVVVANALGTGLLETPALPAFLPRLCRALLGEELQLESVPTWWCGEPESLRYVLDHLADLVIKPAFPASRMEPEFPADLSAGQRTALAARIKHRPRDFVAQERLDLSATPVLDGDRLVPRKLVVRSYLAAESGGGFVFMPGGLTRVSASSDTTVVSMQRGGGSKDTWVLADAEVSDFSLLPAAGYRVALTRSGGDLPSRAADNLFWLGRYAERAEGLTRLLRGIVVRLTERSGLADCPELPSLLTALAAQADPKCPRADGIEDPFARVFPVVFAQADPNSLVSVVRSVRLVASVVRDLISLDMWRVVNTLSALPGELTSGTDEDDPTPADVLDLLNRTVTTLAAFGGLVSESMTRGEGWRFLDMGRKLERALHLIGLLRATLVTATEHEGPVLDAVLEVVDSGMTYRRRYLSSLRAEAVLDLVVADETNPRSLATQLAALVDDVDHLPRPASAGRAPEQRFALAALASVRLAEPDRLAVVEGGTRPGLRDLLGHVAGWLPILSDAITQQYLSHLQTSRHMATPDTIRRTGADSGDRL